MSAKEVVTAKEIPWKAFIRGEVKKADQAVITASHAPSYNHGHYLIASNVSNESFFGKDHSKDNPDEKRRTLDALQWVVGVRLNMTGDRKKSGLRPVSKAVTPKIRRIRIK